MFAGDTLLSLEGAPYTLDVALAQARDDASLQDFGDDAFLEPLEALIACVGRDVHFTPAGSFNFKATVHRMLVNRLRLQRDLLAYPEILAEDVSDPLIVLGMPRTGTTKLQRLMSADPGMQKLALWRLLNPAPMPGELPGSPTQRMAFAKLVEDATRANADFTTSHETAATEADEDSFLLLFSFDYVMLYHIYPSRSYLDWVRQRPQVAAHRFEKTLLQYLQWQDGGRRGRRWVLKNPGHIGHLESVHEVFPKATYIHSHRSLAEVLPSYCRLMEAILQPLMVLPDLRQFGRDQLYCWGAEYRRYGEQRAELGDTLNLLDVPYLDVVRDPIPIVRQLYARAGLRFTPESAASMQRWTEANRQHKFGKAAYSLERYGLTCGLIEDAFGTLEG